MLWDAVHEPPVARPQGGRSTLIERTKCVFNAGRRLFGEQAAVDFGGTDFTAFRAALRVRDRLMHPKRTADLALSFQDLTNTDRGRDWFRASTVLFMRALLNRQEAMQDALRRSAAAKRSRK